MAYLPDKESDSSVQIDREFLFTVINTCDENFFREALAEIESRRCRKILNKDNQFVEIDEQLL